jgi:hypothetical protein
LLPCSFLALRNQALKAARESAPQHRVVVGSRMTGLAEIGDAIVLDPCQPRDLSNQLHWISGHQLHELRDLGDLIVSSPKAQGARLATGQGSHGKHTETTGWWTSPPKLPNMLRSSIHTLTVSLQAWSCILMGPTLETRVQMLTAVQDYKVAAVNNRLLLLTPGQCCCGRCSVFDP